VVTIEAPPDVCLPLFDHFDQQPAHPATNAITAYVGVDRCGRFGGSVARWLQDGAEARQETTSLECSVEDPSSRYAHIQLHFPVPWLLSVPGRTLALGPPRTDPCTQSQDDPGFYSGREYGVGRSGVKTTRRCVCVCVCVWSE